MLALEQTAFEVHPGFAVLSFPCALVADGVARWTDTGQVHRIELVPISWDDVFH